MVSVKVPEVSDIEVAFGCTDHLPAFEDLPQEYRDNDSSIPSVDIANKWFSDRLDDAEYCLEPVEGVDIKKAHRALRAIMVSFSPQHEHKIAGVAWLMDQWFVISPIVKTSEVPS